MPDFAAKENLLNLAYLNYETSEVLVHFTWKPPKFW